RTVAVNVDAQGVPVEFGHTWFAGDRITLTVAPDDAG
ncbi:MAG: phosphonate metabolism transcriptional regulator PhnF, partial [Loktanella sp.]|nr:phosphonate metabolism transcriptional regulator PhnF [Loktanella sp.]